MNINKRTKRRLLIAVFAFIISASGCIIIYSLNSVVEYAKMSTREQAKAQLGFQEQKYGKIKEITIERPWYSLDTQKWTYYIRFGNETFERQFKRINGYFREIRTDP